jgi:hypothetical protein
MTKLNTSYYSKSVTCNPRRPRYALMIELNVHVHVQVAFNQYITRASMTVNAPRYLHNAYRSNFKAKVCHEQVASLLDMRCFGYEDTKFQSCNSARPAMKLTGKEDEVMMQLVPGWWSTELAEERSWHIVKVAGRGELLVIFKHRAAGGYHAVCSFLRHQGSKCAFPCIWCVARDAMGKDRECKKCDRHNCVHTPFTSINPDIVDAKEVQPADVGPEPAWFSTSIEASHNMLKPRREAPLTGGDKAADVQARSLGKIPAATG